MKYMGSKRAMLQNGLGSLLALEAAKAIRFVDLFAGSGAVSCYVARQFQIPVRAFDLQRFSAVLTEAVINRKDALQAEKLWEKWENRAQQIVKVESPRAVKKITKSSVEKCRSWSSHQIHLPITRAYGGHYFSPIQSVWIDALRKTLPKTKPERTVALAALVQAASECAAAPGHTAQPFQSTRRAKKYLREAWEKDVTVRTRKALVCLASQHARRIGRADVADANEAAKTLRAGDLVFIDPPYSGVHYSRFYHVLETIAQGRCGEVSGEGRYPHPVKRPRSQYSIPTESAKAIDDLLGTISSNGANVILTFPDHECSNGLSGDLIREIARKYFHVKERVVRSRFSTLGGIGTKSRTKNKRAARQKAKELMLLLRPK